MDSILSDENLESRSGYIRVIFLHNIIALKYQTLFQCNGIMKKDDSDDIADAKYDVSINFISKHQIVTPNWLLAILVSSDAYSI